MSLLYPPIIPPNQIPTENYIRSWFSALVAIYGMRNGEYRVLRSVFDGSFKINPAYYPSTQLAEQRTGNPFQDRVQLVYNVANATVRRYMDSMSTPPRIDGVPEGLDEESMELADKRSKFCEMIWQENDMPIKLIMASYYQALLDKAIFNVRPAPHLKHKIKIELAVPDYYFPITRGDDWQHPLAVIYGFRTFENADFMRNPMTFNGDPVFNTVLEYWDYHWYVRLENGRMPIMIKHDLGIIPWYECHNLPIPHRYRGQGDVDQSIGLNEYLNMLMSAMGDMIAYAASPIAVVRGTKVGGTNLPFEPRAVWELERDAQVGFLQWTGAPPSVEAQILRTIQAIEDTTGVSSPAFGREIPSGTSGQAVRSLLAGFNTRLGTKQQLMGEMLVKMNAGILNMAEKMFPDEEFRIAGENVKRGKEFGKPTFYTVKPREFAGWHKTRVIFQPLDPASTYFQEVDKYKNGLQSKYTTLKSLGVQNVHDELERIRLEKADEAQHEQNLTLARQGQFVHPEDQKNQPDMLTALRQIYGGQGNLGNPEGVQPFTGQTSTGQRKDKSDLAKSLQRPTGTGEVGSPGNVGPLAEVSEMDDGKLNLQDILAKLKLAVGVTGRAAISGDILTKPNAKGGTILLDIMDDANAIKNALGHAAARFEFKKIDPNKPLPTDASIFSSPTGTRKKNRGSTEFRRTKDGFLSGVVLSAETTNNAARVYTIGLRDERDNIVPIGKTDPQRRYQPEQGELVSIKVGNISKRDEDGITKWGVSQMIPVKSSMQAAPSSFKDLEHLFNGGRNE